MDSSSSSSKNIRKLKVLMLPWLAHGHVSPFTELAREFSHRNFQFYICTTPVILESIKDKLMEISTEPIELHLPPNPSLPSNLHTTKALPPHLISTLAESFMSCGPTLSIILDDIKPDLVLYDMCCHWVPPITSAHGIPAVFMVAATATMQSLLLHKFKRPSHDFPFADSIFLRDFYAAPLSTAFVDQFIKLFDMSASIVLVKGCSVIEEKYISYLSELSGKKVLAMGPLVHSPTPKLPISTSANDNLIFQWLDKKEPFSTVLVSFGSEVSLHKEEFEELAYGLELSNIDFIWVIKFPSVLGLDDDDLKMPMSIEEALPSGFLERVVGATGKGFVVDWWAPQAMILGHENIGGFVSHCGWGSTMESMYNGVPIIGMPRNYDQPIVARLVEEVGVGVEILRDETGKYKSEGVANAIKEVMVNQVDEFRRKANDLAQELRKEGKEAPNVVAQEITKLCQTKLIV